MKQDQTMEQTLENDARERGDAAFADYWRRFNAFRADGADHPGIPPSHTRETLIGEIDRLMIERGHSPEAGEALASRSDAYLSSRYASLVDLGIRQQRYRADALQRNDARAVIRLDAMPDASDLASASARVFHSGVPEAERESVVQQIAYRSAWERARNQYVSEATQRRLDSMDERSKAPNDHDRARARGELSSRIPLGEARQDAFAAHAHESAIEIRARELAMDRVADEHRTAVKATLPPPPPMPRLPPQAFPNERKS